jgi:hypothetical protein
MGGGTSLPPARVREEEVRRLTREHNLKVPNVLIFLPCLCKKKNQMDGYSGLVEKRSVRIRGTFLRGAGLPVYLGSLASRP